MQYIFLPASLLSPQSALFGFPDKSEQVKKKEQQ
jgi:hypothetical protein